jgi:SH3-like domain-containing protein
MGVHVSLFVGQDAESSAVFFPDFPPRVGEHLDLDLRFLNVEKPEKMSIEAWENYRRLQDRLGSREWIVRSVKQRYTMLTPMSTEMTVIYMVRIIQRSEGF